MSVINTNNKALMARTALQGNERTLTDAMQQLSTGKRINSSKDDASGMAIAAWMTSEIRSLNQSVRNAGDAVSLLETADGASTEISAMLQRMRELGVLAINDTYSNAQRSFMDKEFQQLKKQIVQIANKTEWNGFPILNGSVGIPIGHQSKTTALGSFSATPTDATTLPSIATTDLSINGLAIGLPSATDDALSSWTNAADYRAYSAVSRAAAINAKFPTTGVRAIIEPTLMTGTAMTADPSPTSGTITINGVDINVTTVANDTTSTRDSLVRAINAKTPQTGVIAKSTAQDVTGIQLVAHDGRNILVALPGPANFASITGLQAGLQTGNLALTTPKDASLTITSPSGRIDHWGLSTGEFKQPLTRSILLQRAVSSPNSSYTPLQDNDLKINGFAVRGTLITDDNLSKTSTDIDSSDPLSSAIAMAKVINEIKDQTKVSATALGPMVQGQAFSIANGTGVFSINGTTVMVVLGVNDSLAEQQSKVLKAINVGTDIHGGKAILNDQGGIDMTTADGRNLTVEFGPGLLPNDMGLSSSFSTLQTFYGTVSIESPNPFSIEPGSNGYSTASNFKALGFVEGGYGTASDGELNFQVGARTAQTISVEMPDFGSQGALTGLVTSDVNLDAPLVGISTVAKATETVDLLDRVLQNVNEARANIGAVSNRLSHTLDNLTNVSMNMSESRSKIEDTDYAAASSSLARAQIIQQAATAVLAQANASQQSVMKLLQ